MDDIIGTKRTELGDLGHSLGIFNESNIPHVLEEGELGLALDLALINEDGSLAWSQTKRGESFTRQFFDIMIAAMQGLHQTSGGVPCKDVNGVTQQIWATFQAYNCTALITDTTYGMLVGTNTTAPTINDYQIGTLIPHGVAAGQLQYSAMLFSQPASDPTTSQFTITRNFSNASGGTVTVQEIALYVKATLLGTFTGSVVTPGIFMTIHDLTGAIAVNNGQTLTVNYRPQAVI